MDSDLVLTECFSRRILRFTTSPINLIHSERVSNSTSSFLAHCLAYGSHVSMIISKFWCHENETGSLNSWSLPKRSLRLSFCTILRSPWPNGAYKNSEPGQVQGRGFWGKTIGVDLLQTSFVIKKFGRSWASIAIGNAWWLLVLKAWEEYYFGRIFFSKNCSNSKRRCPYLQILFSEMGDFLSLCYHIHWQI